MEEKKNHLTYIVAIFSIVAIVIIVFFIISYSYKAPSNLTPAQSSDVSGQAYTAQNTPTRTSPTGGLVYSSKGIILTNSTLTLRLGKNIVATPALNTVSLDGGIFTAADMGWLYQGDFRGYFFNGIRTDAGIDVQSGDLVAEADFMAGIVDRPKKAEEE